jgi:hypothetical protein
VRLVERSSILTQFGRQRRVVEQPAQHRLELAGAGVEQPAVAAQALPASTSQRPLASTGTPSAHASIMTIDRLSKYDGMTSASAPPARRTCPWSLTYPRWRMCGCAGIGSTGVPMSTRSSGRSPRLEYCWK